LSEDLLSWQSTTDTESSSRWQIAAIRVKNLKFLRGNELKIDRCLLRDNRDFIYGFKLSIFTINSTLKPITNLREINRQKHSEFISKSIIYLSHQLVLLCYLLKFHAVHPSVEE
jgi:hypothetical protein